LNKIQIGGIIQSADLSLIRVLGLPATVRTLAAVLKALGDRGISVQVVVQCGDLAGCNNLAMTVAQADREESSTIAHAVGTEMGAQEVQVVPSVGMVAIYGPHFRERPAIAGAMFSALAEAGIEIMAISTSISTVACVIAGEELTRAVDVLKGTFVLPK